MPSPPGGASPPNAKIHEAVDRVERELAEFIRYMNDEVVPEARKHSSHALRIAAQKLSELADTMDKAKHK